jgi:hypothetical protein
MLMKEHLSTAAAYCLFFRQQKNLLREKNKCLKVRGLKTKAFFLTLITQLSHLSDDYLH